MRDPSLDPDWRLIAGSIPHIVWTTAADGALEFVNRRGIDYLGATPEEMTDWNWVRLVHPADAERTESAWLAGARTGRPCEHKFRLRRADGSFRWHIARAQPVRDDHGTIVRWVGTLTDIEEQRQFEDRLLDTQRRADRERTLLTTVLHAAPVAFAYLDREARFVRLNDEAAATFGGRADDLIGRTPADLSPWLWEQAEPAFCQVLDTGEPLRAVPVIGPAVGDGQVVREWLLSYYPVRFAGETAGVGIVAVDITDRRRSERVVAAVEAANRGGAVLSQEELQGVISSARRQETGRPSKGALTEREREVLVCISEGLSNKQVAERLGLTVNTVRNHVQRILYKLDAQSKLEAVVVLEAERQAAERQRQRLLTCLLRAEEDERRRIAADLHDDALQLMAAAAMQAGEARRVVSDTRASERVQELEGLVQAAIGRLRSMLFDLRPSALDRDGLRAVLQRYLAYRLDEAGVAYELTDELDCEPPLTTSLVAFRIAQEAVTNVAKHARASTVTVALGSRERGLSIRITDDGRGFAADDGRIWLRHSGLRAMEERAELFGGHLRLWSAPGAGTTVDLWVPDAAEGVAADPRGHVAER